MSLALRANPFVTEARYRSDDSLYEASRFYRSVCQNRTAYRYRRRAFPEMLLAYNLYTDAAPLLAPGRGFEAAAGVRWRNLLDALLLSGLEFDNFSSALGVDLPADAIRLYHDAYFDVREYITSEPAVYTNVLSVSDQPLGEGDEGAPKSLEQTCLVKVFGYVWGPHALLEHFFSRSRGQNRVHQQWVRAMATDLLNRQALAASIDVRNMYREESIELYKLAQKNWQIPQEEISDVESEIRRRFLHSTVTLLSDKLQRADKLRAEKELTRQQALQEISF